MRELTQLTAAPQHPPSCQEALGDRHIHTPAEDLEGGGMTRLGLMWLLGQAQAGGDSMTELPLTAEDNAFTVSLKASPHRLNLLDLY